MPAKKKAAKRPKSKVKDLKVSPKKAGKVKAGLKIIMKDLLVTG